MQSKDSGELETIGQKISSLLTYRSGLIKEIKNLHSKRRDLGGEIKNLSEKIRGTRESLNRGYNVFKDTRIVRSETLSKIREIRMKIRAIEEDLKKFEYNFSQGNSDTIAEKLKATDWKLQTEKLTRDEEKQLVEMVKDLELKLRLWKKAYATRQELYNLRGKMGKLKEKLDDIAVSKEEADIDLQAGKERLASDLKARDQLFSEMEELNEDISELERAITKTDEQLEELRQKRHVILTDVRQKELALVKNKENELLKKAKGAAKEKLAKGEKLTFEELKLALEEEPE